MNTYICRSQEVMSISVNQVSKMYGAQKALDDVSFEVKPGEILGFLGPNGAGKSTMMKIISAFIPQNAGEVSVCGFDVLSQEMDVKKSIGYLPENNPLYLDMYVREYLEFTSGIYRIENPKEKIDEVISLVGLTKEQHKKIGALSKGYRQRVGLAQAFIHDPDVLILDEPTTGLDPNQILEIRDLIKNIGKNKTVILSTHIMQEVEAICDRVVIINEGKIVADAEIGELKKLGKDAQYLKLSINPGSEEALLEEILSAYDYKKVSSGEYEIKAGDLKKVKREIMQSAVEKEIDITRFTEGSDSLESIFRSLTTKKKS